VRSASSLFVSALPTRFEPVSWWRSRRDTATGVQGNRSELLNSRVQSQTLQLTASYVQSSPRVR
jgi:hypothetical protein